MKQLARFIWLLGAASPVCAAALVYFAQPARSQFVHQIELPRTLRFAEIHEIPGTGCYVVLSRRSADIACRA